ncbi:hypothetical protein PVAP13_7KG323601 [Panicum virgatum]|uniref:Uncharacterized protein n=1 Tax=Panicum virgatum TaxID=38727 RepID=A0A8T0QMJ9_PANVG|nr:hypothetical protein PVAP13_7KG323601 [Panicum virgatum]
MRDPRGRTDGHPPGAPLRAQCTGSATCALPSSKNPYSPTEGKAKRGARAMLAPCRPPGGTDRVPARWRAGQQGVLPRPLALGVREQSTAARPCSPWPRAPAQCGVRPCSCPSHSRARAARRGGWKMRPRPPPPRAPARDAAGRGRRRHPPTTHSAPPPPPPPPLPRIARPGTRANDFRPPPDATRSPPGPASPPSRRGTDTVWRRARPSVTLARPSDGYFFFASPAATVRGRPAPAAGIGITVGLAGRHR